MLPRNWHASRDINPQWQDLKPGDRVEDYGLGEQEYFLVITASPASLPVHVNARLVAIFAWVYGGLKFTSGFEVV